MIDPAKRTTQPASAIPADDPSRQLSVIDPDDPALRHVAVVGDTYTILLSGAETAGKYSLIDMNVPIAAVQARTVMILRRGFTSLMERFSSPFAVRSMWSKPE
jgi:hypothetical protein